MHGIYQCQHRIQHERLGNFIIHEKGLRHRARVGQTCGLDHHTVKRQQTLAAFGCQQLQRGTQVFADGATHATIAHLDDLLVGLGDQNVGINVLLTELVFNDGNLHAVSFGKHTLEQRGLARAQKAGQDGGGDECHVSSDSGRKKIFQNQGVSAIPYPRGMRYDVFVQDISNEEKAWHIS